MEPTAYLICVLSGFYGKKYVNAIVIEHVKLSELPAAWRAQLPSTEDTRVTVRIETEPPTREIEEPFVTDDPAFGIWRDHDDVEDVEGYLRKLRGARYNRDGSRRDD